MHSLSLLPPPQSWSGPFEPHSSDQPWPAPRCLHASCCLVDPSSDLASLHQRLVTFWGKGSDNRHVEDIWVLAVAEMEWKKVRAQYFIHRLPIATVFIYNSLIPIMMLDTIYI